MGILGLTAHRSYSSNLANPLGIQSIAAAASFLFVLVIGVSLAVSNLEAAIFVSETVDSPDDVGLFTSIDLDSTGNPHISYLDRSNIELKYAYKDGSGNWQIETVDTGTIFNVGEWSSIRLDDAGQPHISYFDRLATSLKYAVRNAGIWSLETVVAAGDVGRACSLDLDSLGNPHISYRDQGNMELEYATKSGGVWSFETVESTIDVRQLTSIRIDSSDNPHISYYDGTNECLKYAVKLAGTWNKQTVDNSAQPIGEHNAIALDGNDAPHISYNRGGVGHLYYATKSTGSWSTEVVDTGTPAGTWCSIDVDSNGEPHISYRQSTQGELRHAVRESGVWSIQDADSDGNVGEYTSIVVDAANVAHFSYYDILGRNLKYTSGPCPVAVEFPAAIAGALTVFPNPALEGRIVFRFSVPTGAPENKQVQLSVFDVSGRLVHVLHENAEPPGIGLVSWNGRRADGGPVGTGVYFVRYTVTGREPLIRRFVVID